MNDSEGGVLAMETQTLVVQSVQVNPSGETDGRRQDSLPTYIGLSVLLYVLLMFVLAPRQIPLERHKSSL